MKTFEIGKEVLRERIEGEVWKFVIVDVFHLSSNEYARNEAYNDTLGNYEPEKELPTESVATIKATSPSGDSVELKWCPGIKGVYPHIRKKGWTKGLFLKLNQILNQWKFPDI